MPGLKMFCCSLIVIGLTVGSLWAAPTERVRIQSQHDFATTLKRLEAAVKQNKLAVVNRANAQAGAKSQGVKVPGNQVWGVYGPKFAVRMLNANVDAGFEAPIRLYIVENPNGTVDVSYIKPSVVFQPYGNADLDTMAQELDGLFAKIVATLSK